MNIKEAINITADYGEVLEKNPYFGPISALPHSTEIIKIAIRNCLAALGMGVLPMDTEWGKHLAVGYVSLACFIEDNLAEIMKENLEANKKYMVRIKGLKLEDRLAETKKWAQDDCNFDKVSEVMEKVKQDMSVLSNELEEFRKQFGLEK